MFLKSKKGGAILKIIAVIAFILLLLSIEVPRRAWIEQNQRRDLARKRMVEMSDCQIVYLQETKSFSKDLKKVYDFAASYNELEVDAPDIDVEVLDIDTTRVRISFTAVKHFKDLNVVPSQKELEMIEKKDRYTSYLESVGCPTASLVMQSDAEEIEMLLKGNPYKDHYRWLKEKYYKSSENKTEFLYDAGKKAQISLLLRNPNLKLRSGVIHISSNSNILAVANYKGKKDIFWDFVSRDKINIHQVSDPSTDRQRVNMAKYVFPDIETDKEPYLCPSTAEPFKVNFNLSASVGMSATFFRNDAKIADTKGREVLALNDNEMIKNYFLGLVKLKAERKVADLVREYEMDGDSTYSSEKAKNELFAKYLSEQIKEAVAKEPLVDEIKRTIDSPDYETEKRFSEKERFKILFDSNPGAIVAEEIKKEYNAKLLSEISCIYKTEILKTDTVSVKIESPITENSEFKGYSRNLLQQKFLFGIQDDENAGYVDNGSPSWKSE
jgi:hypothetical protein